MTVLAIHAHHNRWSLCHAGQERFTESLLDAGHTNEAVDLHAIRFDPADNDQEGPDWIDDSVPDDVLEHWHFERSLVAGAREPLGREF